MNKEYLHKISLSGLMPLGAIVGNICGSKYEDRQKGIKLADFLIQKIRLILKNLRRNIIMFAGEIPNIKLMWREHWYSIHNTFLLDKLCIDIDVVKAEEKGLATNGILNNNFYKCASVYKTVLDVLLYKALNLKYYDDLFINDPVKFICNASENYDVYQYISNMGMKFLYIRNNLFVERLSIEQIKRLISDFDKLVISPESEEIVKQTYADTIKYYVNAPDSMNVEYGPFNPAFFAPNNSVVIGANVDFFADNGLDDNERKENFFKQNKRFNEIIGIIRSELENKLNIPVTVIRYDENSTIKISQYDNSNKKYSLQYLIDHAQVKETRLPGSCRVYHDVSIKKWCMKVQLDEKRIWFLSVFFNDDGTFSQYSLDAEFASDSHYEFYAEEKIRKLLYQNGDEDKFFHEILIEFIKKQSGEDLLTLLKPFIVMCYHYD